jgi:hypothetical protein
LPLLSIVKPFGEFLSTSSADFFFFLLCTKPQNIISGRGLKKHFQDNFFYNSTTNNRTHVNMRVSLYKEERMADNSSRLVVSVATVVANLGSIPEIAAAVRLEAPSEADFCTIMYNHLLPGHVPVLL